MIALIEQAIKQRLSDGLGQMVSGVHTYGGEFDGEGLAQVVNQFPAVWVLFAGVKDSVPVNTRRNKYRVEGVFTVLVGDRASGSEEESRLGGLHRNDVGSYRLIRAVRLLLANQSLGLKIEELRPKSVKSLFTRQMEQDALSVFALDFEAVWHETALPDGEWPQMPMTSDGLPDYSHPDAVFDAYAGRLDPPYPDFAGVRLNMHYDNRDPAAMTATVETQPKD